MIELESNGKPYIFKSLECGRSLDELAGSFRVTTNKLKGIWKGDDILVYIDGELFLTGYVYSIRDNETDSGLKITITGHSRSFDLIKSTLENITIEGGLSLGDAIDRVLKNVNSDLIVTDKTGKRFTDKEKLTIEFGDNSFETIAKFCRKKQSLVTDNEDGDLLLTTGAETDSRLTIRNDEGGNVLASSAFEDDSDLFSEYHIKSQLGAGLLNLGNEVDPKTITNQDGIVRDKKVRASKVYRASAEQSSTSEECEDRAAWNYAMRLSRARGLQYTVSGHSQNGKIYTPGQLISVEDPKRGVSDKFLMKKVTFKQNEDSGQLGGNTTIIDLVPRGTYRIVASEPQAAEKEAIFSLE